MLKIDHLTKKFHGVRVVDSLCLNIDGGELYCFLGPNGAGKTTTIKMIVGLLKPDEGDIELNGIRLSENPIEAKKQFGFIPDQPFVYEKLTPREFLRFIGGLYGLNPDLCDHRINEWLVRFDLTEFQNQLIGSFSHGMRQKVSLAAAIIHEPPLLVIDEPMVGLDPKSALTLKSLLRDYCLKGNTVFISTHSMEVAEQIAHRIGIFHRGNLLAEGDMHHLKSLVKSDHEHLEEIFLELTETGTIPQALSNIK